MIVTMPYQNRPSEREGWGLGPWDVEPDQAAWLDFDSGLIRAINRHFKFGHWCCYVAVLPGHPFYGIEYEYVNKVPGFQYVTYSQLGGGEDYWFGISMDGPDGLMPGWRRADDANRVYFTIDDARRRAARLATALLHRRSAACGWVSA